MLLPKEKKKKKKKRRRKKERARKALENQKKQKSIEKEATAQKKRKKEKKQKNKKGATEKKEKEKEREEATSQKKRKQEKCNLLPCGKKNLKNVHMGQCTPLLSFLPILERKYFAEFREKTLKTPPFIFLPFYPTKHTSKKFHSHFLSKVFRPP